jgi:hypothetical protein
MPFKRPKHHFYFKNIIIRLKYRICAPLARDIVCYSCIIHFHENMVHYGFGCFVYAGKLSVCTLSKIFVALHSSRCVFVGFYVNYM